MNVGSTFSGVGGFDLGFERAGMRVLWQAELDEWCRRVLRWHWPDAAIYDDVRSVDQEAGGVDLLCGGFPCQDLSIAGKRAGLAGERSGLFFEFARIADVLKPRWIVLENVVGLFSSAEGRDFGILLSTLAQIGYGCAWRVVDARYFGVPQRRRRVFIVGCLGDDGERAVRALGAGGEGDLETSDCSWQGVTAGASGGAGGVSGVIANTLQVTCGDYSRADGFNAVVEPATATSFAQNQRSELRESDVAAGKCSRQNAAVGATPSVRDAGGLITEPTAKSLTASNQRMNAGNESFVVFPAATGFHPTQTPITEHEGSPALGVTNSGVSVSSTVSFQLGNTKANGSNVNTDGVAYTLDRAAGQGVLANALDRGQGGADDNSAQANHIVPDGSSVRRLTPVECERLMGWPDGWTAVDGDKTPDRRRYAACGNGVVANVSEWIGLRIVAIEEES